MVELGVADVYRKESSASLLDCFGSFYFFMLLLL
jgi:hypothetical protein